MRTDVIAVSSRGARMESALLQVDKVAAYKGLSAKNALHLRLLAEEAMGLMRSITGETEGLFWIEDQDDEYELHLQVKTTLSEEERTRLLSVSSTGKNESAKGIMGRLRAFFDWEWSLRRYESALDSRVAQNAPGAREAWDELEKSVVKNVADDVKVYIRSGIVELVILKKLA